MALLISELILDNLDFRAQKITKTKRDITNGKRISPPGNITVLNVYALSDGASKYMKKKLIELKGKIDKLTL